MLAIGFALLAFIGWGAGNVFGGLVSRKIGGYSTTFWQYIFCFLLSSLYLPFAWGDLAKFNENILIWTIILNVFGVIPVVFLYEGMRIGNATIAGTISSAFSAIVVILSVIFLGDRLNLGQIIAVVIIILGVIYSSVDLKTVRIKSLFTDKSVPYALAAMIGWGIYFAFIRIPVQQVGWFWPAYMSALSLPLLFLYMKFRNIPLVIIKDRQSIGWTFLNALAINGAAFAYNLTILSGQISVVAPIAGSYPVLFVILSRFIFKDKITKQQLAGIIITLLGIVYLSTA